MFVSKAYIQQYVAVPTNSCACMHVQVPLVLQKVGSKLQFPVSFTLELNDRM